ncbi:MAG: flagellin domain protein [Acidimicrobiaceae bacterium]|nr:flagellin domain protein [Acidimicrobiaceae bacterium]
MLTINDNLAALGAQNNLNATDSALATSVSQLSSGLQIQTAADDPAGYSIAQELQYEINGYQASVSNAQNAVSVLQTTQGALNQQAGILQQMNTVATQAANSQVQGNATASAADQQEFSALQSQLDQIANSTTYAGVNLLNGSVTSLTFQVGPENSASNQVAVALPTTLSASLAVAAASVSVSSLGSAQAAISAVQAAINSLAGKAATVGAAQNQVQALANNITVAQQNLTAAHANLVDVNVAAATSRYTSLSILEQSGVTVLAQAQQLPQLALKLI